jgi:hypothetical protein
MEVFSLALIEAASFFEARKKDTAKSRKLLPKKIINYYLLIINCSVF